MYFIVLPNIFAEIPVKITNIYVSYISTECVRKLLEQGANPDIKVAILPKGNWKKNATRQVPDISV